LPESAWQQVEETPLTRVRRHPSAFEIRKAKRQKTGGEI
jgi:hypothetical protein